MARKTKIDFDGEIEAVKGQLLVLDASSEEYTTAVRNLETLIKAKGLYEDSKNSRFIAKKLIPECDISRLVVAGVSIAEVLLILAFENEGHFLHSKAMGLITRIKM